jgi:hypothetical protein
VCNEVLGLASKINDVVELHFGESKLVVEAVELLVDLQKLHDHVRATLPVKVY